MEWHREKVLNTLTEMYLILRTIAFVGNDSFKTPPVGETIAYIAQVWFWHILPQSLQTLKVPWASWTLSFSSFHWFSIGFKSGDWLEHSSSFNFFFWNQLRVSLAVFGIIVLMKCPPLFHLHHPGRWQQIFIKNVSVHFSIHPSFNYMNFASTIPWCFWGDVHCHLTSKHGVYYGIQRV